MDILKGFGSEGSVISIMLSVFIIWHIYIRPRLMKNPSRDRRKAIPGNPNDKPGKATECLKHMKKLTELNTEIINIKEDIGEIKENNRKDHKDIFDKIDKIRNKRR